MVHTTMVIVNSGLATCVCMVGRTLPNPTCDKLLVLFEKKNSMASLARCLRFSRHLSVSPACNVSVRSLSASSGRNKVLKERRTKSVLEEDMDELAEQWDEFSEVQDSPSAGHIVLQEYRQTLRYLRLIEHEMPKLVGVFL